ncbi:MAG: hypothetical protein AB7W16_01850 [Candidatus Obscuribacterales bacterium]
MNGEASIFDQDRAFLELCALTTAKHADSPKLIFSLRPWRWFKQFPTVPVTIVDVSSVGSVGIDLRSAQGAAPTNNFQTKIFRQLLDAGWPSQQIGCELSYGDSVFRSRSRIDLALFDSSGNLYLALETKERIGYANIASIVEEQLSRMSAPPAVWYGATDGTTYYMKHLASGLVIEEQHAVSYSQLEEYLQKTLFVHDDNISIVKPLTEEEISELLQDSNGVQVIVDETTWGREVSGGRVSPHSLSGRYSRELFSRILSLISESDVAAITAICPTGWLSSQSTMALRIALAEKFKLNSLIEGQGGHSEFHARMSWSLLIFGGERDKTLFDVVSGDKGPQNYIEQAWFSNLKRWLDSKESTNGFVARLTKHDSWQVSSQDPEIDKFQDSVKQLGSVRQLQDVCEIFVGLNKAKEQDVLGGELPLLTGRGLQRDGILVEESRKVKAKLVSPKYIVQVGDILARRITGNKPFFVHVTQETTAVASDSVIVIRPVQNEVSSAFICDYLNSKAAIRYILSGSVSMMGDIRPTLKTLTELPIPSVDHVIYRTFELSAQVEGLLRDRLRNLEADREACLLSSNAEEMKVNVMQMSDNAALLESSLASSSDFDFQVANFYPFPLAFGYRLLRSIVNPAERYQEVLRVCENMLAFVASVSLALLKEEDRLSLKHQPEALWSSGISPGHWRQVIQSSGESLGKYTETHLCQSLSSLSIGNLKRPFGKMCEEIITSINDFKHGRGPKIEEEFIEANTLLEQKLHTAMEVLSFFARHPIRQVKDLNPARYGTSVNLRCLRYVGDHPGLSQEELTFPRALPKNDLFLEVARGEWVNLFPFLSVRSCPHCRAKETYFVDYWFTKKNSTRLKSFERGHTEDDSDVATVLSEWQRSSKYSQEKS